MEETLVKRLVAPHPKRKVNVRKSHNESLGMFAQQEQFKDQPLKGWEGDEAAYLEEDDFNFC